MISNLKLLKRDMNKIILIGQVLNWSIF